MSTKLPSVAPDRMIGNAADEGIREAIKPEMLLAQTLIIGCTCIFSYIFLLMLHSIFPQAFNPAESIAPNWVIQGEVKDWLLAAWPVLAWGAGVTTFSAVFTWNTWQENQDWNQWLFGGVYISALAGITEEIRYRWLFFLINVAFTKLVNWIFFGALGFGLIEWIHNLAFGPFFNWVTLGSMSDYLVNPAMWAFGAALISTNAEFRDGHKYQGWFGMLNSWVLGFYFFFLALNYGLLAAIVVHTLYDSLIFVISGIDRFVERYVFNR